MRKQASIIVFLTYYSALMIAIGCAVKKPVSVAAPTPQIRVVTVHSKLQGCSIQGSIATCECTPVNTKINSKTGATTVVCRFHVENSQ